MEETPNSIEHIKEALPECTDKSPRSIDEVARVLGENGVEGVDEVVAKIRSLSDGDDISVVGREDDDGYQAFGLYFRGSSSEGLSGELRIVSRDGVVTVNIAESLRKGGYDVDFSGERRNSGSRPSRPNDWYTWDGWMKQYPWNQD